MSSPVPSERNSFARPKQATVSREPKPTPRKPGFSIPRGFDELLHFEPESSAPRPLSRLVSSQYRHHLYVRQQPIAARACGTGDRDRRVLDPPPIVQLLLTDFDPNSQEDRKILEDPQFALGCLLFSVSDSPPRLPTTDGEKIPEGGDDGVAHTNQAFCSPLLYGKTFMSPFFVNADPEPNSAPTHPTSNNGYQVSSSDLLQPENSDSASKLHQPATFFIFADLSIRSAGFYRLQFRLMDWGSAETTGQSMPILAESWSDIFRVYPAKDFPGMRDSSILANGLKEMGFVELKTRRKPKEQDTKV